MTRETLQYQFLETLKTLPCIEAIWLFGSRARGDYHPKSEIDLAILCPYATPQDWQAILAVIEEADTLLKIDCINFSKEAITPELYDNILKDKKVLYVKKPD